MMDKLSQYIASYVDWVDSDPLKFYGTVAVVAVLSLLLTLATS